MTNSQLDRICLICKDEIKPHDRTITCSKCGNIYHESHNAPCPYHSTPLVSPPVIPTTSRSGACLGISISLGTLMFLVLALLVGGVILISAFNGSFSKPDVSNVYMGSNENGDVQNGAYSPNQDFFVFFDLENAPESTRVKVKWYAVNVSGYDTNTLINEGESQYGSSTIYYQLYLTDGGTWTSGRYKAEIYINDNLEATKVFDVK